MMLLLRSFAVGDVCWFAWFWRGEGGGGAV